MPATGDVSTEPRAAHRIVGVLGGMGPLATADFYAKLVRLTPARADQDHLRVVIDSNPKIPDRTAALTGEGPDPTPALVATARALVRAGAELIAIPCNSAHAFLSAVRQGVTVPVLDMVDEVAAAVAALDPAPRAIGLLAASGTLRAGLYQRALAARRIGLVEPTPDEQEAVMAVIRAVKTGDLAPGVRERARESAGKLIERGAEALVLGCTELPLVLGSQDVPVPVFDSTAILAAAAVREATRIEPRSRRPGDRARVEFPGGPQRLFQHSAGSSKPARRS